MRTLCSVSQPVSKATHFAALTLIICTMVIGVPSQARATVADCTALKAAATLQSKTPFHAVFAVTATTAGAFPTEHHEEIWVDNKMYTALADRRWLSAPVTKNPMGGFTGPIEGFSECRPLPAATIRGEATTGYAVKLESGRKAQIWISPKTGLPIRDVVDQDILLVTLDFDYANVRAPATH